MLLTLKSPPFLKFDVISEPKLSGDGLSLFGRSGVRDVCHRPLLEMVGPSFQFLRGVPGKI